MKKLFNTLLLIFTLVFACFLSSNEIRASEAYIFDDVNELSQVDEIALKNKINAIDADTIYIIIITDYYNYEGMEHIFFENYLDNKSIDYNNSNIMGLTINTTIRSYDLFTYGDTRNSVSDKEIDIILDDMYSSMKRWDFYNASSIFIDSSQESILYKDKKSIAYLLVPMGISLLAAIITVCVIYSRYKKHAGNVSYPLDQFANIRYTSSKDILVNTHVTKTAIQTSSSSSGGSHASSGGGHRGGRSF